MKAEIKIPKGWRVVRCGRRLATGDKWFDEDVFKWISVVAYSDLDHTYEPEDQKADDSTVYIRRVGK